MLHAGENCLESFKSQRAAEPNLSILANFRH